MNSGSTFAVHLGGITAVTGYGQVDITGTISLNSPTLAIDTTGYNPISTAKYFILVDGSGSAISGTFAGLANGSPIAFGNFVGTISYTGSFSAGTLAGGHDVVIYNVASVPEPNGILAAALVAFGLLHRLRRGARRLRTAL